MMGMGEPLLNLEKVLKATRLLTDPDGIGLSPKRITVSTSGIVPKIRELGPSASTAETRDFAQRIERRTAARADADYPQISFAGTARSLPDYPLRPWEKLTFEYVLLRRVNDTDADARRVVRCSGISTGK